MKAVVIPERSFHDAFRQAEYDLNKAVHDAVDHAKKSHADAVPYALASIQTALVRLRDRLIETQL